MAETTKGIDATGLKKLIGLIKTNMAAIGHKHSASDITSGTLSVSYGGTGATTVANARKNMMTGLDEYDALDGYDFVLSDDANDGSIGIVSSDVVKNDILQDAYGLSGGGPVSSGTDLDTMKTVGNYICSDDNASTVTNSPVGDYAFTLKISDMLGNGEYYLQNITRCVDGLSWQRIYDTSSTTWSDWKSASAATTRTVLWSGAWTAGGIQVDGLQNYTTFVIYSNSDTAMIGFMNADKSSINCYGILCPERNVMKLESGTFAVSGNQLVRTMPRAWTLTGTAISSADGTVTITRIEGLL